MSVGLYKYEQSWVQNLIHLTTEKGNILHMSNHYKCYEINGK